jgi:DNA-binding NarL/FixJ family response regulator
MSARKQPKAPKVAARIKILIVDDHPLMREGLRNTINHEPDLVVCGEAETAHQALDAVKKLSPALALVDVSLPGKSGLELVKDLKAMFPELLMLGVSMHDEALYAERMLRAGAGGYLSKQTPPADLIKAIRQVLGGGVYVSKEVSESLLRRFSGRSHNKSGNDKPAMLESLTDREIEIFQLIGAGRSPKEIARQLHLSPKTVAVHNGNIREKLALKTYAQLIRFAVQNEDLKNLAQVD